ncbi:hypothetical protein VNI00_000015 [Paramarasmius palmivorus]|uniref:F-box domain-containing protein n=1 Tax=Paramarasmius palmivorus TaxID=297713 RepID=A0AAW0EEM2_9AGAR
MAQFINLALTIVLHRDHELESFHDVGFWNAFLAVSGTFNFVFITLFSVILLSLRDDILQTVKEQPKRHTSMIGTLAKRVWRSLLPTLFVPSPRLPFEIVDKIVEHVVRGPESCSTSDRQRNINACSLISRTWLPAARQHFFRSHSFTIPLTEKRFDDLQALCHSRLCTLHLAKIKHLNYTDASDDIVKRFFEWFASNGVGGSGTVNTITIGHRLPSGASYRNLDHASSIISHNFSAVTSLRLQGLAFTSYDQFSGFLSSFPRLESLACAQVVLNEINLIPQTLSLELHTLTVDHASFFGSLYGRITFPRLRSLAFIDLRLVYDNIEDRISRLQEIGFMLEYTGRQLQSLELTCEMCTPVSQVYRLASTISQTFDLPKKAPLLRDLTLFVRKDLLIPALSFRYPHPRLSSITTQNRAFDYRACDFTLQKSTPLLKAFTFPVAVAGDGKNGHIRFSASEVLYFKQQLLGILGPDMPWCLEGNRLRPKFTLT